MKSVLSKKNHLIMISAMIIGGVIEWYELFLFIHWNHVFSKLFFYDMALFATYNVLFMFFIGLLGRPVGALLFGNIGDRYGRKIAFTLSIALMIIPSFLIAGIGVILPGSGITAAIIVCLLRFIQGMAVGAELPGAMCYLSESALPKEKVFICSFTFVGPHIGILFSQLETYIFETYFSEHFVDTYGWRISFIFGGILALLGVIFRYKLNESPLFAQLKSKKLLSQNPIFEALSKYWKKLFHCFFAFIVSSVVFFMYTVFIETYVYKFFGTNKHTSFTIGMIISLSEIIFLPFWGFLGDRYSMRKFLIIGVLLIMLSAFFIYFSQSMTIIILFSVIMLMGQTIQSGLIPSYSTQLFPTAIRYTGIAIAVSCGDSIVGGAMPWIGGLMSQKIGTKEAFIFITMIAATISLFTFLLGKRNDKTVLM